MKVQERVVGVKGQQRMKRKTSIGWFLVVLGGVLIGLPVLLTWRVYRQERLNRDLIVAIKADDTNKALATLKAGADPNARDQSENKPLSFADQVKHLFEQCFHLKREPASDARPTALLLLFADYQDRPTLVEALLDAGADPNLGDSASHFPLLEAALSKAPQSFHLLLSHGTNVHQKDANGWTALHCASAYGTEEKVDSLLKAGANIEAKENFGSTPLHIACSLANSPITLEVLLRHHADINARDNEGSTPLMEAIDNPDIEKVDRLLAAGANVEIKNNKGQTALHVACSEPTHHMNETYIAIVKALLRHHSIVNARDYEGRTPLCLAADDGSNEIADCLLAAGAVVEVKDRNGQTPLHYASKGLNIGTLVALLRHNAQVNARDKDGKTPLDLTVAGWCVDELKQAGGKTGKELDRKGNVNR